MKNGPSCFPSVFSEALQRWIQPSKLVFDNPFTLTSSFTCRGRRRKQDADEQIQTFKLFIFSVDFFFPSTHHNFKKGPGDVMDISNPHIPGFTATTLWDHCLISGLSAAVLRHRRRCDLWLDFIPAQYQTPKKVEILLTFMETMEVQF